MKINQRNYFHKWIANEVITEKKPGKKFRLGRDSNTSQICLAPNVWSRSSVGSSGQLESWRHGFESRRSLNFSRLLFCNCWWFTVHLWELFLCLYQSFIIQQWKLSAFLQFSVTKMPKWSVYVRLIEGRKTGTSGDVRSIQGCTADPLYPNINGHVLLCAPYYFWWPWPETFYEQTRVSLLAIIFYNLTTSMFGSVVIL